MDREALRGIEAWFDRYFRGFEAQGGESEKCLGLKREHSLGVRDNISLIGTKLGLSDEALCEAEAAALLHDIGRCEQYARYRTFDDHRSVDHARLGADILQEDRALEALAPRRRETILRAVRLHNRAALPEGLSAEDLFLTRLLRDADKLDIWRVLMSYYRGEMGGRSETLDLGLPDTPGASEEILRCLSEGRFVKVSLLKNLNDFKLLQIAWVYDLNFQPSFEALRERGCLGALFGSLRNCPGVSQARAATEAYLARRAGADGRALPPRGIGT